MLASHPERAPKINAYKYFYVLGLLSGIGLTLLGLSIVATIKSDSFDANLSQGIAGLFLALMANLPSPTHVYRATSSFRRTKRGAGMAKRSLGILEPTHVEPDLRGNVSSFF